LSVVTTVAIRDWRRIANQPRVLQSAVAATLLLPPALLYTRAAGDALMSFVAILFLARACVLRDGSWLQSTHSRLALIFWAWLVLCTVAGGTPHAIGEALAASRLFLFVSALEAWVLAGDEPCRQIGLVVLVTATWIVVETWQQYLFGTNIFGDPRWASGVLTGPFEKPRAGGTLQVLYLPAFLPPAMALLGRRGARWRLAGGALLCVTALTMVLIGQRMPILLFVLSLCVTACIVRRVRWSIGIALIALAATLAASPVLMPVTYATVVVEFLKRMRQFWDGPYGLLYERAMVMVQSHPWLGLGFDGFRDGCADPRYMQPVAWLPVTNVASPLGCSLHPHNYWLEIATSTGVPGLLLFASLCAAWLVRIGHGVFAAARPLQVALLVTMGVALWPIASTSALFTVPTAGWFFLMAGWGLAVRRNLDAAPRLGIVAPASLQP
jgi:O-antigen ligase